MKTSHLLALGALAFFWLKNRDAMALTEPAPVYSPYGEASGADWLGIVAPDSGVPGLMTPPYYPSTVPDEYRSADYGVYF